MCRWIKRGLLIAVLAGIVSLPIVPREAKADRQNSLNHATTGGLTIAEGTAQVTGSSTFSVTGLGTATRFLSATLGTMAADVGAVIGTVTSANNVKITVYGAGTTTISGTAAAVDYIVIGTP